MAKLSSEDILNALDLNRVTKDDIVSIVDKMVAHLNNHGDSVKGTIEEIRALLLEESKATGEGLDGKFGSLVSELLATLSASLSETEKRTSDLLAGVEARVAAVKDGQDADPELVTQEVLRRIVIPTAEDVMNGLPALGERTRDSLELLPDGEKLVIDAIEGLRKELDELRKLKGKEVLMGGGPHYLAGTNVTIDGNVINATGGGSATIYTETPTGNIDGVNTVYTTAHATSTIIGIWVNGQFIHTGEYTKGASGFTMGTALPASLSGTGFTISYT